MSLRYRIGDKVADLADWLRYPPTVTCRECGNGRGGIHEEPWACDLCLILPSRRDEHHAFVAPSLWSRIRGMR